MPTDAALATFATLAAPRLLAFVRFAALDAQRTEVRAAAAAADQRASAVLAFTTTLFQATPERPAD